MRSASLARRAEVPLNNHRRTTMPRQLWVTLLFFVSFSALSQQIAVKPRVGILVTTHGRLSQELKDVVEIVIGPQRQLRTVSIAGEGLDDQRRLILEEVALLNQGCGVLIFADFFGGTPANLAISVMDPGKVEVVSGVNVPALIKAVSMSETCDVRVVAQNAVAAGQKYLTLASDLLKRAEEGAKISER